MQTIVNVDGNEIRRLGVNLMLKEHFTSYELLESSSLNAFSRQYNDLQPRIVILGNHQTNGKFILELIKFGKLLKNTTFVVYSDLNKGDNFNKYLDLGISGLMTTSEVPVYLVQCVEAVLENRKFLSQSLMDCFLASMFHKEQPSQRKAHLSRREMQVANYLYNGMKTTWIANYLDLTSSTISTIKRNIFTKLNVTNMEELSQKIGDAYMYQDTGETLVYNKAALN